MLAIFTSCNKDEVTDEVEVETAHIEVPQGFIDLSRLINEIGHSEAFKHNESFLDINYVAAVQGRGADFTNAYIDTDEIHLIETPETNFYTLKLINNNPNERSTIFYNLIFELNNATGEVKSFILQYDPDLIWGLDQSNDFQGSITKYDNSIISLEDLNEGLILDAQSRAAQCLTTYNKIWYCPNNFNHPDWQHDDQYDAVIFGCTGSFINYAIPCDDDEIIDAGDSSTGGPDGPGGSNSNGGSTNSTDDDDIPIIILHPCTTQSTGGSNTGINDNDSNEGCVTASEHFNPYICGGIPSENVDEFNNWANENQAEAQAMIDYLTSHYMINDPNDCAVLDTLILFDEESWEDYGCQRKIVEQAYNVSSPITDLFQDIFGNNVYADVEFLADSSFLEYASTDGTFAPEKIPIRIGSYSLQGSDILLTIVTIHEVFHANLYYLFKVNGDDGDPTNDFEIDSSSNPTYAQLLEAFARLETGSNDPNIHHNFIASYKDALAQSAYSWATSHGGYAQSTELLNNIKNLTWVGLKNTSLWIEFENNPLNQDTVSAINFMIAQESIEGQFSIGNFCN